MAMKDEFEKLRYAADLLKSGTPVEKQAALEHVEHILRTSTSTTLLTEAKRIKRREVK
jgi:hypothetical protein